MTPSISFATEEPLRRRLFPNHEWALLVLLAFELVIFAFIGDNFLTSANGFEVIRLSVEIGLLALALTRAVPILAGLFQFAPWLAAPLCLANRNHRGWASHCGDHRVGLFA